MASRTTGTTPDVPSGALPPVQTRSERPRSLDAADLNPLTARSPEWRFAPLDRMTDVVTDALDGSAVPTSIEVAGAASVEHIPMSDSRVGRAGLPEDAASALAWSQATEALLVSASAEDASEVWVTRDALGPHPRASHLVIEALPFAKTIIVIDTQGEASLNENVEIVVGDSSEVVVVSLQQGNETTRHIATHFCHMGRDARLVHAVITLGGSLVRINPQAHLAAPGGHATMLGLYTARSHEHVESHVFVNHDAPHTVSRVTYKGALQGEKARTVWIGDVLIGREATGTDSYEQNRNLVLTDGARADSIPNLEIETGDILGAGHASATGRFDDEQLFYLQARGIDEPEARRLVVRGFLNEVLAQVPVARVQAIVHDRLDALLGEAVST